MEFLSFEEQVFFSTIRIALENTSKKTSSIGTGFIVKVNIDE